jgi:hypothetical protein
MGPAFAGVYDRIRSLSVFQFKSSPRISALSTRFLRCTVSATNQGNVVDPTGDSVQFAFKQNDEVPTDADWVDGSWETSGSDYLARALVGPGGAIALVAGSYKVWIKIVIAPETLVESVGDLTIY